MDHKDRQSIGLQNIDPQQLSFTNFTTQHQQKWEDPSIVDYSTRIQPPFIVDYSTRIQPPFIVDYSTRIQPPFQAFNQIKVPDPVNELLQASKVQDWDPNAMLNNLSFLEQKIHQLQGLVHSIIGRRGQMLGQIDDLAAQQQQLITADITSIIVQLISTAGSLLPSPGQFQSQNGGGICFPVTQLQSSVDISSIEEHELKGEVHEEDAEELVEFFFPGTYEILQLEKEEILAPHTHLCTICGKGFKRDANLRMHMRHGNEYKTPAALVKPNKVSGSEPTLIKRYSCPVVGCKKNKDHQKFQHLKTILCVKNHYKRTHCDKNYICSRYNAKKFSVMADLKTHEKHCGKDKWLCSCGTTFSRKDKLFGHVALFQGHTPAIPLDETKGSNGPSDPGDGSMNFINFSFVVDVKGSIDDPAGYFSPMNFETCNFGEVSEFPRSPFDDSESSLAFLLSGSNSYTHKNGED